MSIGQKIKKIREFKNLNQEYIADKLGMSVQGYGKIERDETDVPYSRLQQIANVFGLNVEDVVSFDEKVVFNIMNNKVAKDFNVNHHNYNAALYEKHIKALEENIEMLKEKLKLAEEKLIKI